MSTEHTNDADHDKPDSEYEEASRIRTGVSNGLNALKEEARVLGITFSNNIGIEALRGKVDAAKEAATRAGEAKERRLTREQEAAQYRQDAHDELMALVRCRIMNMDPRKRDIPGEIVTVATELLGTVRKFIPFTPEASENGYHIPKILYNELISRQFQQVSVKRNSRGEETGISTRLMPEYNITVLPPLTEDELHELRQQQQAAARLGGNMD